VGIVYLVRDFAVKNYKITHPDSFGIAPLDTGENLIGSKYLKVEDPSYKK